MTNEKHKKAEHCPDSTSALPKEVQLEIAKQNHDLAEFRYRNLVRRGQAWDVRPVPPSRERERA